MSNLRLKIVVDGGTPIDLAAKEACALAEKLDITVEFDFNGVLCMANPGGSPAELAENWKSASNRGGSYPMASTHRAAANGEAKP